METYLKARRVICWHSILHRKQHFVFSFAMAQFWKRNKKDWINQTERDLEDFGIEDDFLFLENMTQKSFKDIVKKKARLYMHDKLLQMKKSHSKMQNLRYPELELQPYLLQNNISLENKFHLIAWRCRMAKFGENYKGGRNAVFCPLCPGEHLDTQKESFTCPVIRDKITIQETLLFRF